MSAHPVRYRAVPVLLATLGVAGLWPAAHAAPVADPVDDFLPSFTGTPAANLPAVPEPQTWALLALGLAGVAAQARRRRG